MSAVRPVRVLVSYRHESAEHAERVRALCDQLRRDGVDAVCDRYVAAPAEGWSWWMEQELAKADRVIVVCSASYLASTTRNAQAGQGLGTSWEWHLIRREFYTSRGTGERITPVYFDPADAKHVPAEAWDRPRYCLAEVDGDQYSRLLNDLYRRSEIEPLPLGQAHPPSDRKSPVQPKDIKSSGTEPREATSPRVYISYTHDSEDHKAWVAELAERLHYDGVDVTFDYWFMEPGKDFWELVDSEVARADVAVLICTPVYQSKATGAQPGGLRQEYDQIVTRSKSETEFRVIPILSAGDWTHAVPPDCAARFGFELRSGEFDPDVYTKLRRTLLGQWHPGPSGETADSALMRPVETTAAEPVRPRGTSRLEEVVLLVHGIRTFAGWQPMVKRVLEEVPNIRVVPIKYGYLDGFRFWFPFITREAPINDLRREIQNAERANPDARLSIIAHSFGTYAISRILCEDPSLKIERVILTGSIVPRSYRWDYIESRLATDVVNDYGTRDIWPVLAKCLSWGYGDTGRHGFGRGATVRDRGHNYSHSEFFNEQFVRTYWKPWFESNAFIPSGWEERAPPTPWWLTVLSVLPLQWILSLMLAVLIVWFGGKAFGVGSPPGPEIDGYSSNSVPLEALSFEAIPVSDRPLKEQVEAQPTTPPETVTFSYRNSTGHSICLVAFSFSRYYGVQADETSGGLSRSPWTILDMDNKGNFQDFDKFEPGMSGWYAFFAYNPRLSDAGARMCYLGTYNLFSSTGATLDVRNSKDPIRPYDPLFTTE